MSSASLQMPGDLSISPSLWQTGCSGSAVIAARLAIMWKSHMFYSTYIFHPFHHGHSLSRVTMWEYEWLKRDNANSLSSSGPWEHSLKWMLRDKDMRHNSLSGLFNLVTPCSSLNLLPSRLPINQPVYLTTRIWLIPHSSLSPGRTRTFLYWETFPSTLFSSGGGYSVGL